MIDSPRVVNSSFNQITKRLEKKEMDNYYNSNYTIDINLDNSKYEMEWELELKIYKSNIELIEFINNNYIGLPFELNRIVANFIPLNSYITSIININFCSSYPFNRPLWVLSNISTNIDSKLDIPEYYRYLINNINDSDWTAAMNTLSDLKILLTKLNFVDEIINY